MTYHSSIRNHNSVVAEKHPFHLVDTSPWPLYLSTSLFITVVLLGRFLSQQDVSFDYVLTGLFFCAYFFFAWVENIINEADSGFHVLAVQQGLIYGFILFIVSEAMLFFSFFWAFFHLSLSPAITLGMQWPPLGLPSIDPWDVPLTSTIILILSALYVTLAEKSLSKGDFFEFRHETNMAILFGTLFTIYQLEEYNNSIVAIDEGAYGSILYAITGLHGVHVIVGCFLIAVGGSEALKKATSNLSFIFAGWYWHFVDFIWIFVFIYVY